MNVRNLSLIIALAVTSIGIAAWLFTARSHAQTTNNDPWQAGGPHKVIDNTARAVSIENEASVRALTEAVFNYPHTFGRMPSPVEIALKDKLTQAELNHLRGNRTGVREEDLANFLNTLADRFRLPDYARTNANQIRTLRMSLALNAPIFMGRKMTTPDANINDSINPEMTPLQAVHVASVMLDQKIINPDFQVTPTEWDQNFHQKLIERIQKADALRRSARTGQVTSQLIARNNPRHDEMRQALSTAFSSMTVSDGLALTDEALKTLKIN